MAIPEEDEGAHLILPVLIQLLELPRPDKGMGRNLVLTQVNPGVQFFQSG